MSDIINKPIDNLMLKISEEDVKKDLRNNATMARLVEEVGLMKTACQEMDIANLRLGPHTATALEKIKICREIMAINHEKVSPKKLERVEKNLKRIEAAIQKRLHYCQKIDSYIEKLEANALSMLKADFIDDDQARYDKMRKKLADYKANVCLAVEKLTAILPMPEPPPPPPVDDSPKLV
jgi:uncharacterized protein YPO0396